MARGGHHPRDEPRVGPFGARIDGVEGPEEALRVPEVDAVRGALGGLQVNAFPR